MPLAKILPHVNAALNATTAILLLCGFWAIAVKKDRALHRRFMLSAVGVALLFLTSYLTRIALTGPTRFPDMGWVRTLYLWILGTHTSLAVVNVPLIIRTLYLASKERFEEHKRIARFAFGIWLYVSVTGVVVYWMLYYVAKAA